MATPLNIIGGWYSDASKPWSQQDICNYIPFVAEQPGTLSPVKAVPAPGLKPFVEIASNGGIRGMEEVEGKLLVVAGTTLYQISNTGVAIPRGTIPGTGLVSISYNQAGIANQVLIGNDSAGYVYDTSALTLTRITDPAFPGTKAVDYLDSYLLGVEPLGRFWFHSNLADAEDYNALDRYEAETSPDRIVTLAVSNEEVVVFGQTTTDFFVNTGATTGTFQAKGVSMTVGCASAHSVVKLDNTLFWLDNFGVFQRLNGYSPQPVSTRVLEDLVGSKNADGTPRFDWSRCVATTYQDSGRKIAYWTFREGLTIGYDVTTGMWHRREAYGLNGRDRISCIVNWNRKWIAGDYVNGRLYELDWDYMLQVDQPHVRRICTAPLAGNGNRITLHQFKLAFDAGGPETIAIPFPEQPDPPTITGAAPDGVLGEAYAGYAYTLTGDAPLKVTLRSGSLPPDLNINAAGVINTDETTLVGTYTFTLRVTDRHGLWSELTDTIFVTCIPGTIGLAITDTLTIPDAYQSAYVYPLESGNLGVAYAADGVSVGGFYHLREYDSDLVQVGSTVDVEWMAGSIGDSRLWLRGVNEGGLGVNADDNGGQCELIDNGVYQANFRPSYCNYDGWWYSEAAWAPEFGGLVWFGKDSEDVDFLYLGVRKTGDGGPSNVPGFIENTLLKFPLSGSAPIAQVQFVTGVGTVDNPRFWMTRARNGNIYVITPDGDLQTYDDDLTLLSTAVLTTPVTGSGNNLRGFGVDGDVLALVYNDGGGVGQGRVDFRNIMTETLIQSIPSADMAGDQVTRVLFSDDSCYIQCRNWVGRIEYAPPQCELP